MSHQVKYGGIIWTNHALDRMTERGLPQDLAWQAYKYPDRSFPGKTPGTTEYQKHYLNSLITLIAKPNERNEIIVLSTWIDPPLAGTKDARKQADWQRYQKAGFWGKLWYGVKKQLFG